MVKKISACLGLLLIAGCGFDWFPESNTFNNTSTAQGQVSSARRILSFKNKTAAGRAAAAANPAYSMEMQLRSTSARQAVLPATSKRR